MALAVRATAHEARHSWQLRVFGWRGYRADPSAYEADANAFAEDVADWWAAFGSQEAAASG